MFWCVQNLSRNSLGEMNVAVRQFLQNCCSLSQNHRDGEKLNIAYGEISMTKGTGSLACSKSELLLIYKNLKWLCVEFDSLQKKLDWLGQIKSFRWSTRPTETNSAAADVGSQSGDICMASTSSGVMDLLYVQRNCSFEIQNVSCIWEGM